MTRKNNYPPTMTTIALNLTLNPNQSKLISYIDDAKKHHKKKMKNKNPTERQKQPTKWFFRKTNCIGIFLLYRLTLYLTGYIIYYNY